MDILELILIAVSASVVFAYHILGFAVLVGGAEALPAWTRAVLTPTERGPLPWPLRALGLPWVVFMTVVSLLVTAFAVEQVRDSESHLVLIIQLVLMAGWTVFLLNLYHRPRA